MSSQPTSPSSAAVLGSSQPHSESNGQASSSPQSRADSAVHVDDPQEKADPDSSFQSNSSERHPKGKRKRTAAKDKVILESAYNANPKPDKAARLDIVKRVSLNEKEVQIWFQNRRQNDRRKSRPLSPQEIAALQYGSMQVLPEYAKNPSSSLPTVQNTSPVSQPCAPKGGDASPPSTVDNGRQAEAEESSVAASDVRRESGVSVGMLTGPSSQPVEFTAGHAPQLCRSNSVGYFANRLHAGTSFQHVRRSPDSYRHEFMPAPRPSSAAPGAVLPPPQSSKYRLSMSVEGKAELVPQPSPPRLSPSTLSDSFVPPDRPHLYRSHSAADSITLPPISTFAAPFEPVTAPAAQSHGLLQPQPRLPPRGLYRSRSRDVHAWEMACEANSGEHRDELTAYAERESSGSAIAAISLLRTLSSSSHSSPISHTGHVLQSNTTKRNARPSAQHNNHHAKKPKLGRASSSVARLQNTFVNTTTDKPPVRRHEADADTSEDIKKVKMSMLLSPSGNDSDKENWSPDEIDHQTFHGSQRPAAGRRPLPSAPSSKNMPDFASLNSRRRALEDGTNKFMLGRASTAPTARRRKGQTPIEIFEDGGDEADASDNDDEPCRPEVADDEVEKFMRGEVSPSKKGAASAIAGLLALSQGAWR
ncbi:hypothetical protein N0V93_001441 [Gnomoniopsis smithogilvyi]|uniref:Homeobox domain-containing protein n=1 Tax=Gnomoniopsis smithogilvyi TaxID=1191159 RepID=A0A9W9D174_9PEZI|nr:hypothetical protein N0V93_001441 [Gnomoniopsis smithogilvyi]